VADHLALWCGDRVFPFQREPRVVACVFAGGGVIRHQPCRRAIPGEGAARTAARHEVVLGQRPAGVGAHQKRPIAPLADEIAVVPAALDHHMGEAECQRAVGAGPHPEPQIGLVGEARMARVDHDEPHAALQRFDDRSGVRETGIAGVVAPQNEAAAVLDVRHRATAAGADAADAVGIAGGEGAAPAADIEGDCRVRGAKGVRQPTNEAGRIRDRGGGGGRQGKGDRLRPVAFRGPAHRSGGQVQGLVPADPFPAGVWVTLGPGAAQRVGQPLRMIDELRCRAALGAERLARRVRGIGLETGEAALFDHGDAAASGDAQPAIAVNALRAR
jgi:hypothetical protein